MTIKNIDTLIALCKRRGFIYPGSDIYGGFGNSYTYGPYGSQLKKNICDIWWSTFVEQADDTVGVDGDVILHTRAWEASGHLENFNDQMVDCKKCKTRLRADHLIEGKTGEDCEGWEDSAVSEKIREEKIQCPQCGASDFTEARQFNMMFQTQMQKTGETEKAYLRPETAQTMFLEFKNILDSTRQSVPFGIAQIGRAFRNEITPGNFIFRRLEFEQMEIEYFVPPPPNWEKNREKYKTVCKHINEWEAEDRGAILHYFDAWQEKMDAWCNIIGLGADRLHHKEHAPEKLSHYSKKTVDIEYDFPFGQKELYGLAYRTDFDLAQHEKFSGKKLKYRNPQTNEEYIPHVIEPTFGLDRTILAVLCESYQEENMGDDTRIVLRLPPLIAPVKIAVFPLMKKDGLPEKSREILTLLRGFGVCEYDEGGSIGKRYRRHDEIGTPLCITVDYDTLTEDTVTIRHRDTMVQERRPITELVQYCSEFFMIK